MNRKQTIDIAIIVSCATGMLLSYLYLDNRAEKAGSLFILAITGVCFMVLAIRDGKMERQSYGEGERGKESRKSCCWEKTEALPMYGIFMEKHRLSLAKRKESSKRILT